jgi:hypothetical protein
MLIGLRALFLIGALLYAVVLWGCRKDGASTSSADPAGI